MKPNQDKANVICLCLCSSLLTIVFFINLIPHEELTQPIAVCLIKLEDDFVVKELKKVKFLNEKTKTLIKKSLKKASSETGLPEALLIELIKKESSFRPKAVSSVGASGLTQLMPSTAKHFCSLALEEIFDIEKNIICGAKYLKKLQKDFNGDLRLALAAYNIGPGHIQKLQKSNPKHRSFQEIQHLIHPQTRHYAISINNSYLKTV